MIACSEAKLELFGMHFRVFLLGLYLCVFVFVLTGSFDCFELLGMSSGCFFTEFHFSFLVVVTCSAQLHLSRFVFDSFHLYSAAKHSLRK